VATDFFGAEIGNLRLERLVRDTLREWGTLALADRSVALEAERVGAAAGRFFGAVRSPEGEGPRRFVPDLFEGAGGGAGRELVEGLLVLRDTIQALSGKPEGLLACARRAEEQAAVLQQLLAPTSDPSEEAGALPAVRWIEQRGRGTVLHISPLDVAPEFRRTVLEGADSVVLTSATLSAAGRFDFIRARLGIDEAREFQSDSPFDYPRQAVLYVPRHLPDPRDAAFLDAAADEIRELLTLSRGRALVLFTSIAAMQATHRRLNGALPYSVMVQGESARSQLLERFRREIHSVLLATRSFWQGVDVVGESLSCLIVHKLPFAFPGDPVLEARLEFLAERGGDPFWEYQIPSAIISLRQGLGRLIRSGQDRGALCILDGRLHTRGYRHAFLESLPSCPLTSERDALRRFFEEA
jgi:ATP-dependent DNA helicase DinG